MSIFPKKRYRVKRYRTTSGCTTYAVETWSWWSPFWFCEKFFDDLADATKEAQEMQKLDEMTLQDKVVWKSYD